MAGPLSRTNDLITLLKQARNCVLSGPIPSFLLESDKRTEAYLSRAAGSPVHLHIKEVNHNLPHSIVGVGFLDVWSIASEPTNVSERWKLEGDLWLPFLFKRDGKNRLSLVALHYISSNNNKMFFEPAGQPVAVGPLLFSGAAPASASPIRSDEEIGLCSD